MTKHLVSILDWTAGEHRAVLERARDFKHGAERTRLTGKALALLFEKPSLRTRVSFDIAMFQLGGHCVYLSPAEVGLGQRESVRDTAQVLSRYVSAVAARTFAHGTVEALAEHGTIPVINALSDVEHPCQALADFMTLDERRGGLAGKTLAYVGDANNCALSLLFLASLLGVNFRIAAPPGYQFTDAQLDRARPLAAASGAAIVATADPMVAVQDADAVYTDVWTSMGQEAETAQRKAVFQPYRVTAALLEAALPGAVLLHPLPAHHGEEVAEGLLYQPYAAVFDQAENRLHAQKAVLATLLA